MLHAFPGSLLEGDLDLKLEFCRLEQATWPSLVSETLSPAAVPRSLPNSISSPTELRLFALSTFLIFSFLLSFSPYAQAAMSLAWRRRVRAKRPHLLCRCLMLYSRRKATLPTSPWFSLRRGTAPPALLPWFCW